MNTRPTAAERNSRRELGRLRQTIVSRIRSLPFGLASACVLYVALRWLIVDTNFDAVSLWMYETYPMGTLAELTIRHVDFPLHFYYDNAAGQILAGYLTIPSFAAFGPTYLALKVVPFALGFLTLLLLYVFLRANFGRRAANLGAFLFTLGPPTLVKYSVICSGNHFENLFFSLLAITCFYRLQRAPESRSWRFASGLSAGFALFVFLGALIPIGLLVGMHVGLRGLRRTLRDLPIAVLGFMLGILPLILLNVMTNARGWGFLSAKFGDEGRVAHGNLIERFVEFIGVHLPDAGVFEPFAGISRGTLGAVSLACFVMAYVVCVPNALLGSWSLITSVGRVRTSPSEHARAFERVKLVPFVLFLPLAALAYGLSNFRIGGHAPPIEVAGYRYFLPHLLFAIVLLAVVSARAWERGGWLRAGGVLLATLLLACGLSSFALVDWSYSHAHLGRYYEGYDVPKIARGLLSVRNGLSPEEIIARVQGFPPPIRQRVACALGFNVGTLQVETQRESARKAGDPDTWHVDLDTLLASYPEGLRTEIARGAGNALRFDTVMRVHPLEELARRIAETRDAARRASPEQLRAVCEGACSPNPSLPLDSQSERVLAGNRVLIENSTGATANALVRGQGLLCGRLVRRGIPTEEVRVQQTWGDLPERDRRAFCIGYGAGLAEGGEAPEMTIAMLSFVPESLRSEVWFGFGASLRRLYDGDAPAHAVPFESGLDTKSRARFEEGLAGKDE